MRGEKFQEILNQVAERCERSENYGGDGLSNFHVCEGMGVPAWKGVLVMMGEELGRLMNIAKSESPEAEAETVAETLTELATHSIIARILLEESPGSKQPESGPRRGRRQGQRERKDIAAEAGDTMPGDAPVPTGQE